MYCTRTFYAVYYLHLQLPAVDLGLHVGKYQTIITEGITFLSY